MRRNTCRSDFVRYQAKTWKQPCVAFRGHRVMLLLDRSRAWMIIKGRQVNPTPPLWHIVRHISTELICTRVVWSKTYSRPLHKWLQPLKPRNCCTSSICYRCHQTPDHPLTAPWAKESTKLISGRCTRDHKAPARTPEFSSEIYISFVEANRRMHHSAMCFCSSNLWCIKKRSTMATNFCGRRAPPPPRHRLA